MIDRLNFYDLYGYLIPGVTLLMIAGLPFVVLGQSFPVALPQGEIASAILVVVLAYIAGYFVQSMATNAVPSSFGGQYPSSRVLDATDHTFSPELKARIQQKAQTDFGLDLEAGSDASAAVANVRRDGFFCARAAIGHAGTGAYAEQFEGLYSMMRGLAVTFGFGLFYMAGWGVSNLQAPGISTAAEALIAVAGATMIGFAIVRFRQHVDSPKRTIVDGISLLAIAVAFWSAGVLSGLVAAAGDRLPLLWIIAGLYTVAMLRFYVSYKYFAAQFAQCVWRTYAAD